MSTDLKQPITVPFDKIFLDPNNPRIAPDMRLGYDDPEKIFTQEVQSKLNEKMAQVYDVANLEQAIITQGWVPIDSILVWKHHDKHDHYIVVEGNTRTVALRRIRERLPREEGKLGRMNASAKKFSKQDLAAQERLVKQLRQIVKETDDILVYPVDAKTPAELEEKLPRLLGVRHITHAQQWSPYATNLYMLSLYQRVFEEKHGPNTDLALEPDSIEKVAELVSTGATKTRRNVQAASAFSHLCREYEDKLSEGDKFEDADQYYFENILQNKYAQEQFDFGKDDLHLPPEMEEVLFQWAFRYPRAEGDENANVLRKAEDIRLWARMKAYDDAKGTAFATELDVEKPDKATPMKVLEPKFLAHKARVSPLDTIRALLDAFKNLQADTLLSQASHLKPMLKELKDIGSKYIKMIDAAAGDDR